MEHRAPRANGRQTYMVKHATGRHISLSALRRIGEVVVLIASATPRRMPPIWRKITLLGVAESPHLCYRNGNSHYNGINIPPKHDQTVSLKQTKNLIPRPKLMRRQEGGILWTSTPETSKRSDASDAEARQHR